MKKLITMLLVAASLSCAAQVMPLPVSLGSGDTTTLYQSKSLLQQINRAYPTTTIVPDGYVANVQKYGTLQVIPIDFSVVDTVTVLIPDGSFFFAAVELFNKNGLSEPTVVESTLTLWEDIIEEDKGTLTAIAPIINSGRGFCPAHYVQFVVSQTNYAAVIIFTFNL